MRLAILGGSFNPIHIGHMALADEVCSCLHYDKLLFIPAGKPPHKELSMSSTAAQRLDMVNLAASSDSRFGVDSLEMERQGVSYTWDTICLLEKKYASVLEGKIGLVMGQDLLPGFHLWYNAEEIAKRCDIIVALRPSSPASSSASIGEYAKLGTGEDFDPAKDPLFKDAVYLKNPVLPVSSTDIRQRCASGAGFRYLVPPEVFNYIRDGGLYGFKY